MITVEYLIEFPVFYSVWPTSTTGSVRTSIGLLKLMKNDPF